MSFASLCTRDGAGKHHEDGILEFSEKQGMPLCCHFHGTQANALNNLDAEEAWIVPWESLAAAQGCTDHTMGTTIVGRESG